MSTRSHFSFSLHHSCGAIYIGHCTIYIFIYRYSVLLYTTCTDGLYFCVHNCTLLYNLTLPGAHSMLGSVVLCICSSVSIHLFCNTRCQCGLSRGLDKHILTNESPSCLASHWLSKSLIRPHFKISFIIPKKTWVPMKRFFI